MPSDLGASVLLAWSKEISVENSNTVEISVNKIDWPDSVILWTYCSMLLWQNVWNYKVLNKRNLDETSDDYSCGTSFSA